VAIPWIGSRLWPGGSRPISVDLGDPDTRMGNEARLAV
jgi:hypothetical protein